jgi:hypothetical protein
MMDYENAFLGLILAGVLLMAVGIGLMMPLASAPEASPITLADRRAAERTPLYTAPISSDRSVLPRPDSRPAPAGPKG